MSNQHSRVRWIWSLVKGKVQAPWRLRVACANWYQYELKWEGTPCQKFGVSPHFIPPAPRTAVAAKEAKWNGIWNGKNLCVRCDPFSSCEWVAGDLIFFRSLNLKDTLPSENWQPNCRSGANRETGKQTNEERSVIEFGGSNTQPLVPSKITDWSSRGHHVSVTWQEPRDLDRKLSKGRCRFCRKPKFTVEKSLHTCTLLVAETSEAALLVFPLPGFASSSPS